VPLELLPVGIGATMRALAPSQLRGSSPSPDGGVIADYYGPVGDPGELADRLSGTPGVIEHGLFAPHLVAQVIVATETSVETLRA
jgi:ribose 5-phosphate isomerase A